MKTTLLSLTGLAAVIVLSNCTAYVDPGVTVRPGPTSATTTTTQSSSTPYDSVTTRKTTTTY